MDVRLVLVLLSVLEYCCAMEVVPTCSVERSVCEISLDVSQCVAMVHYARDYSTPVVMTTDGRALKRMRNTCTIDRELEKEGNI